MEKKIKITENCIAETLNDELIILNINSGKYHELNSIGKTIWQIVKNNHPSLEELIKELKKEFKSPDIESDCKNFIQIMVEKKLFYLG